MRNKINILQQSSEMNNIAKEMVKKTDQNLDLTKRESHIELRRFLRLVGWTNLVKNALLKIEEKMHLRKVLYMKKE